MTLRTLRILPQTVYRANMQRMSELLTAFEVWLDNSAGNPTAQRNAADIFDHLAAAVRTRQCAERTSNLEILQRMELAADAHMREARILADENS